MLRRWRRGGIFVEPKARQLVLHIFAFGRQRE
jgi:hypothetical protein